MRRTLEKLGSLVFSLLLFGYLATGVHEQFHMKAANFLGVAGHVEFRGWAAWFIYDEIPTASQDIIIGFAGGIGTAIIFGLGWWVSSRQLKYTKWELDDTAALMILAISEFIYSFLDAFDRYLAFFGGGIGMVVAFGIALAIYGRPILNWLKEE